MSRAHLPVRSRPNVTGRARPAHRLRLHRPAVWALVAMLALVVASQVGSRTMVASDDARLLHERADQYAMLADQVLSRIQTSLASLRAVASATGNDPVAFGRAAQGTIDEGVFRAVALVGVEGGHLVVGPQVGGPVSATGASTAQRAALARAASRAEVAMVGQVGTTDNAVLGLVFGPALQPSGFVVYADLPLAALPRLVATTNTAAVSLARLVGTTEVAIYAGAVERPESLVLGLGKRLPLPAPRAVKSIAFGSDRWTLVIAHRQHLVGDFELYVPWILLALGLAATLLATGLAEVGWRRRDARRVSEERFRLLVARSSDLTLVVDENLTIAYASPSVAAITGCDHESLAGTPLADLLDPVERHEVLAALRRLTTEPGAAISLVHRVMHAGGAWRQVETTATNLLAETPIRGLVLNARDVTERTAAEAARSRLASILEATSDMVVVADRTGHVLYFNRATRQVLGLSDTTDVVGLPIMEFLPAATGARLLHEVLPAAVHDGGWTGELIGRRADGTEFPSSVVFVAQRDAGGQLEFFAAIIRDLTEHEALRDQLAHQAFHDPLTDLANRALLEDRLGQALRRAARAPTPVGVVAVDIDDFKTVNDSLGTAVGDELLIEVATRLRRGVRPGETVARPGADEFVVVLEQVSPDETLEVVRRLLPAVNAPFDVGGRQLHVSASFGIAMGDPARDQPEDLLRNAGVALHQAKAQGRGRYVVFEPSMHAALVERLELEADLRHAVERDQLELHYQPIVEIDGGGIAGVEALLRWRHPSLGVIPPAQFIPAAEDTGLIVPIGAWVLREACRQMATWQHERPSRRNLLLSVNLSPRQVQDPELVPLVREAIDRSGIDPATLVLEITERTLIRERQTAVERLRELRTLGARIAIDDFGTGYSTLSYVEEFPVDILKIDKVFVDALRDPGDDSGLVGAIVQLGRSIRVDVIAEGIETPAQLNGLRRLQCRFGQGFLLSRPVPPDELAGLLDADIPDGLRGALPAVAVDGAGALLSGRRRRS